MSKRRRFDSKNFRSYAEQSRADAAFLRVARQLAALGIAPASKENPPTPKGFLVPVGPYVPPASWYLPEWEALARVRLDRIPREDTARDLGFYSLAELLYCLGMDPDAFVSFWQFFGRPGLNDPNGKFRLLQSSPVLRALWASGNISSVGLEEYELAKRGSLTEGHGAFEKATGRKLP